MTIHCHSNWKWGDPVDEFPFIQVINAIEAHGRQAPQAYATLCSADQVVFAVGILISIKALKKDLEEIVPIDMPDREDVLLIYSRLLDHFT